MALKSIIKNFQRTAKYHGYGAAFQLLGVRLLRKVIRFERVYLYFLEEAPEGARFPSDTEARIATRDELRTMAGSREYDFEDLDEKEIERLLQEGHLCMLNIVEGAIGGYDWMNPNDVPIYKLGISFDLHPHEAYIYKGYTLPRFRGYRLGVLRYLFWVKTLPTMSKTTSVCDFSFDNKATLTRVAKLGMKRVGTATLIQIGPLRKLSLQGEFRNRRITPL